MAKIIAPNKQYTGVSAGVPFVNGVGETADPELIKWFKTHGYEVEEEVRPAQPPEKQDKKSESTAKPPVGAVEIPEKQVKKGGGK